MPIVGYYVHDIDPVLLHIWGEFGIRYYGIAYALGFLIAIYLFIQYRKKGFIAITAEQQSSLLFALVLGVLIGGRLGYVLFYDFQDTISNPLSIFAVWKGGMASHGGFIGVIIAGWIITRKIGMPFFKLGDFLATMAAPGLMLGRIANFINGELWGTPSNVSWAVIFPSSAPVGTPVELIQPRHPSQLYEAALEGLFLFIYTQWRIWRTDALKSPGRISGEFLILYAIVRIIGEQFREYDSPPILGMSRGIFYSLFMIILGTIFIIKSGQQPKSEL
ncbi:MAG: prolipoprotein diacylglyceryl transferase [candidate division Zixibacteria bacterium]